MFELIKLNPDDITFEYQNKSQTMYFWVENMFTDAIMNQENFTRTLATVDNFRVEDLEQRSSWTHNKTFDIKSPDISSYFGRAMCSRRCPKEDPHNESRYQLLKYEKGDFFNKHLDRLHLDIDWEQDVDIDDLVIIRAHEVLDVTSFTDGYNDEFLKKIHEFTEHYKKHKERKNMEKNVRVLRLR